MAGMVGVTSSSSSVPQVVINVKNVRQQRLGGLLFQVQLLHLVLHHYRLPGDLLPGPGHPEDPGDPLEEQSSYLEHRSRVSVLIYFEKKTLSPSCYWRAIFIMKFEVAEGTQEVGYQSGFIQKNRIRNGRILISGELN